MADVSVTLGVNARIENVDEVTAQIAKAFPTVQDVEDIIKQAITGKDKFEVDFSAIDVDVTDEVT